MQVSIVESRRKMNMFDIEIGECFTYEGELMIKTDTPSSNAVSLQSGCLLHLGDRDMVEPKSCKVILK